MHILKEAKTQRKSDPSLPNYCNLSKFVIILHEKTILLAT